jgi:ribose/xylose/arabinose/galactoside ABC-type transport system permease subunit
MIQIILAVLGLIIAGVGIKLLMSEFGEIVEKQEKLIEKTGKGISDIFKEGKPMFILFMVALILAVMIYGYRTVKS